MQEKIKELIGRYRFDIIDCEKIIWRSISSDGNEFWEGKIDTFKSVIQDLEELLKQ